MRAKARSNRKLDSELGKLFKAHREKTGLSQGKVCKMLGYTTSQFLSNFERGLCSMPLNKLRELIEIYDMDGEQVVQIILDLQNKYIRSELIQNSKRARA